MNLNQKRFNTFIQGRINARNEARQQLVLRNNLEKRFYTRLNTLFRKFVRVQLHLYKEYGIYEPDIAVQSLNEDLVPLMISHYRRVFRVIYKHNEDKYYKDKKAVNEIDVFGRSHDFEALIENYFKTKQLILLGISMRMATKIKTFIETARADGLTLQQIAKQTSEKFLPLSRSRAALIARTETHNAASYANHAYHKTVEVELGVKMKKKWVATNDARTGSTHSSANGKEVDMNENFIVGGTQMEYAGDSKGGARNVINCRCITIYSDEQDVVLE